MTGRCQVLAWDPGTANSETAAAACAEAVPFTPVTPAVNTVPLQRTPAHHGLRLPPPILPPSPPHLSAHRLSALCPPPPLVSSPPTTNPHTHLSGHSSSTMRTTSVTSGMPGTVDVTLKKHAGPCASPKPGPAPRAPSPSRSISSSTSSAPVTPAPWAASSVRRDRSAAIGEGGVLGMCPAAVHVRAHTPATSRRHVHRM